MISRYSMMTNSVVSDTDLDLFPDVLSVDYTKFVFNSPPIVITPDIRLQEKPYYTTNALYGEAAYDDMLFNINNIPHTSLLFDSETLNVPSKEDLLAFMTNGGE